LTCFLAQAWLQMYFYIQEACDALDRIGMSSDNGIGGMRSYGKGSASHRVIGAIAIDCEAHL
jgi:hypothetical protein